MSIQEQVTDSLDWLFQHHTRVAPSQVIRLCNNPTHSDDDVMQELYILEEEGAINITTESYGLSLSLVPSEASVREAERNAGA
jgi:hypothetical protein